MSHFIGNIIAKTTHNVKSKYKYAKTQYKNFEFEKKMNQNNINFKTPEYIKTNPFYWMDLLIARLGKAWQFIFNFKNQPKRLTSDEGRVFNLPAITKKINHMTAYSKQSAVAVIDNISSLVLKATNGYLDIKKITNGGLTPMLKNFSVTIGRNLNYHNLLIIYKKMGNNLNNYNQKAMGYLKKYQDPKAYQEFKSQYDKYLKKMGEQAKERAENGTRFERFMYKITPNSFFNFRAMSNNKLHKINKYIKSPWYKQKYYVYESKLRKFWESKDKTSYFKYSYYKENINAKSLSKFVQNMNYNNAKSFFAGGMKRQFRKVAFYIVSVFVFFYTLKYLIHSIFNRRSDKNLQEALNAVNELKQQNQELLKYNRELIDKIVESRK
jgi:hypothetical protein